MQHRQHRLGPVVAGILALALWAGAGHARGERSGDFDYYVMALSWSASWCAETGDARDSPQCDTGRGHGWVLHGLWPQYDRGWPSYCPTTARPPSRSMTADMADIMGTGGLAWHQWRKHGVCTGLTARQYFDLSRRAYNSITRPAAFRRLPRAVQIDAQVVEDAFLADNPTLRGDGVTVTCQSGRIAEVRICLSDDLTPMTCGRDVRRDCAMSDALFPPMR
ncbi:MAG: ribonuclease T2 family protein [Paracoccaceae bacterium]